MATVAPQTFNSYIEALAQSSPETALKIALTETERQRAIAAEKAEEYRAMSDIEFDVAGRIVKATMGGIWRLAQMYAGSEIVPKHYQKKPHDCFIACQMSMRLKVDPFAYMQNSYIVHGRPGIEAKLSVAILNTSGKIIGRVKYREQRDAKGKMVSCIAYAKDSESKETVEASVNWDMVVAEGWNKQNGSQKSKWETMPDVMFRYRSAIFLIRAYYPEMLMGMQLVDELQDIAATEQPTNGSEKPRNRFEEMTAILNGNGTEEQPMGQTGEAEEPTKQPTFDEHFASYQAEMLATVDVIPAQEIRDKYVGPDSDIPWPEEYRGRIEELFTQHTEAVRKSRGQKKGQKELVQ